VEGQDHRARRHPGEYGREQREVGGGGHGQRDGDAAKEAVDDRDRARHGEQELGPGVPDVHVGQGAADVVASRQQEVVGLGGVDLGVVVPDPVDRPGVDDVLDRALQHPDVGDQPEEEHRRQDGQGDHEEDLAQRGPLGDQGEGDQGAGQRPDVQGGAAVALVDGDGAGRLEGEVLGGEGLHERLLLLRLAGRGDRLGGHRGHLLLGTGGAADGRLDASSRAAGDLEDGMEKPGRRGG
jgi:hypothetical protein